MNYESKIVATLTLLLAVYESPWTLGVRLAVSAAAVLVVFRHDLWGRWGTRGRMQIEKRITELDSRDFIRKHQRLCCERVLGGFITLAVGLYIWDIKMSTSEVRVLPPLDQALFLVSILAFNSAVQSFWQSDRNLVKKERDRLAKKLALAQHGSAAGQEKRSPILFLRSLYSVEGEFDKILDSNTTLFLRPFRDLDAQDAPLRKLASIAQCAPSSFKTDDEINRFLRQPGSIGN